MALLSTTGTGLAADVVQNSAIPLFAPNDRTGWQLDRTFGVDDLLAVPGGGPGPVTFDKAHPYAPPGRPVPTYRVADLSNPILQDWVKPGMKKANDEVIAGGVVNGCEDPRIDGVRRNRDEISTAVGSMLFAGKEKRGGMGETVLGSLKFLLAEAAGS